MNGLAVLMRTLRKPVLALLATAGLVASGLAGAPVATLEAARSGAGLAAAAPVAVPALGQAGTGLVAEAGERQQTRGGNGGSPATRAPDPSRHGSFTALARSGVHHPLARSHSRSGRESAPSTGPPSFPF